jgi:UDP-N-acetylmuramoyl-tripeptide--D-alanyl-D-alanine ligase
MLLLRASELSDIVGGELLSGSPSQNIDSLSTDTRSLKPGDLFLPLRGERFNGEEFLGRALELGAVGFLTTEWEKRRLTAPTSPEAIIIKVKDTLRSLQEIARFVRAELQTEVVGITGSTGKTSTKDMAASILSLRLRTVSGEASHNNEIGVPLTLLKADENTDVIIAELAMRGQGQIKELAGIAKPTMGIITNIGKSHFEFLGSQELIGRAKAELAEEIPEEGVLILNADDVWTEKLRDLPRCRVVTFGLSRGSNVRAEEVSVRSGKPSFVLVSEKGRIPVELPVLGRHNIYNALAASAAALELDFTLEEIKKGLECCRLPKMRMEAFSTSEGITVLSDAYNANPASMEAALLTLRDVAASSRKIAVLGDMLELGDIADSSHYQLGEQVHDLGVDFLVAVGKWSKRVAEGALDRGMASSRVILCRKPSEAVKILRSILKAGDVVLVKASRAVQMEQAVNSLVEEPTLDRSGALPRSNLSSK